MKKIKNKYANGTLARRGDIVYSDGGRYVVVDPARYKGFVLMVTIENPTRFTRKAPSDDCSKYVPDTDEKRQAANILEKATDMAKRQERRPPKRKKPKAILVLIGTFILMGTPSPKAQSAMDAAFPVAQCQADQPAWLSKLAVPGQAGTQNVLAGALLSWSFEMDQCAGVDQPNATKYRDVQLGAVSVVADRMNDFIHRHGLTEKFFDEDVAGKR